MPSVPPKYAIFSRELTPANGLGSTTATVERSTPPSGASSTFRTMACQWVAPIPLTTDVGAISGPIVLEVLSLSVTVVGKAVDPLDGVELVFEKIRRHEPSTLVHPA